MRTASLSYVYVVLIGADGCTGCSASPVCICPNTSVLIIHFKLTCTKVHEELLLYPPALAFVLVVPVAVGSAKSLSSMLKYFM